MLGVGPPLEDAVIDQAAQPVGQDRFGDVEVGLKSLKRRTLSVSI